MTFKKADIMRVFDKSLSFADFTTKVYYSAILIRDYPQILLLSLSEFINFYSPWNHQKTVDFLLI